jgi:hypothetical protein
MTVALAQYKRWPASWNTYEHQDHTKQKAIFQGDHSSNKTIEPCVNILNWGNQPLKDKWFAYVTPALV